MVEENKIETQNMQPVVKKERKPRAKKIKEEIKETIKTEPVQETKQESVKQEIQEVKGDKKKEEKIEKKVEKIKRDYALINGLNLAISTKDGLHICDMIRGKNIDQAIKMVEEVLTFKRVVKMNNREVPHKHGKNVMAGSYPITASQEFLRLLKQLKSNAIYNELEMEKYVLFCKTDKASKPYRRGGTRFKRSHVMLKLIKNVKEKK